MLDLFSFLGLVEVVLFLSSLSVENCVWSLNLQNVAQVNYNTQASSINVMLLMIAWPSVL